MGISTNLTLFRRWFPWKDSFIVWPLVSMVVNALLASLLSVYVQAPVSSYPNLIEKGIRMIGLLSNASISIVTLTFSLTVLSIQIASQTYSPRLLDDFIKDPMSKLMIAVNVGAYSFCFTLNYWLSDEAHYVPYVSIHLLTFHFIFVIVAFVNFIHFFINGFRTERILARASASSLSAAAALSEGVDDDLDHADQPPVPSSAYKVMADASGYVTGFTLAAMVQQASRMDIVVRYNHQIGEFVNKGAILCYVWDAQTRDCEESLEKRVTDCISVRENPDVANCVGEATRTRLCYESETEAKLGVFCAGGLSLSKTRSGSLDVTLGIQQLSDIAMRALSPGINDPHTAIQCMDVLSSLLAELALMDLGVPNARDSDGHLRLCAPRRSFGYLTSMLDPIRRYGSSDMAVCRRGLRLFGDLGAILTRTNRLDRVPAVLAQLEQWMRVGERTFDSGSNEYQSLRELYDHLLRTVAESHSLTLKPGESVGGDYQDYEITHKESLKRSNSFQAAVTAAGRSEGTASNILRMISGLLYTKTERGESDDRG